VSATLVMILYIGFMPGALSATMPSATMPSATMPSATMPSATMLPDVYQDHKVVLIRVQNKAELAILETLQRQHQGLVVEWHGVRSGEPQAIVPPSAWKALRESGLTFQVLVDDLQAATIAGRANVAGNSFFSDYQTLASHDAFMDDLQVQYPDLTEVITIGTSEEGRVVRVMRIGSDNVEDKPAVFFHAAQHAREWVTPPVIAYLAEHLLTSYDIDPFVHELVDEVDFYLLPIANPDGYEFTWTTDPAWRKNRGANDDGSFGVDLNRNWSFAWGETGSSPDTLSDTYHGPSSFSEQESQILRDFLLATPNIELHIDVHSNANAFLWPLAASVDTVDNQETYARLGDHARDAVFDVHQNPYDIGPLASALYVASGTAMDWAHDELGLLSFTLECRGPGFVPDPSSIILACEENLALFLNVTDWVRSCDDYVPDQDEDGLPDCFDACPSLNPGVVCECPEAGCCELVGFPSCFFQLPWVDCLDIGGEPDCMLSDLCRDGCLSGDWNQSGVTEFSDFAGLQNCFSGDALSGGFATPTESCLVIFDMDDDGDVDATDAVAWLSSAYR
jgi:murein tripeptide amidase MpaA